MNAEGHHVLAMEKSLMSNEVSGVGFDDVDKDELGYGSDIQACCYCWYYHTVYIELMMVGWDLLQDLDDGDNRNWVWEVAVYEIP